MALEKNVSMVVSDTLRAVCQRDSYREAIYDGYRRLTYKGLDEESNAIASELIKLGIEKGDHVAVCLPNWHEFVVTFFAIAKAGATIVPFNTRYQKSEIEYILNNAKVKAAFFTERIEDNQLWDSFYHCYQNNEFLQHLISVRFEHDEAVSYQEMAEKGDKQCRDFPELSAEDVFIIMYTSGTTGKPKGAMLTHSNVVKTADMAADFMDCTPDDVFLIPVPAFHIFGMVPSLLTAVTAGSKMVFMEEFKGDKALQLIQGEKITVHHGVPTMFILELNQSDLGSYDLTSLRTGIVAAAPVPREIIGKIRDQLHCEILVSYGMTEASPCLTATTFDDDDDVRAETVGRAMPGVEVNIVNQETGDILEPGEVGEIVARSPGIMKGYFEMPEKTAEVLSADGWYKTGDLGVMDVQGNVSIVGRKKDLIIRGGYNIYPREIEEHFYEHSGVSEVAIVGLPDTVLGEVTCAAVTAKDGAAVTEEELKEFIRTKVADYKVPDKVKVIEELPMTASGKISRLKLQEQMEEHLFDTLH